MQDLLKNDNINKVLGFVHETGFYQKFFKLNKLNYGMNSIHSVYLKLFVRRMWRKMVPCVKDHNPLGTQKIVSLMFEKE
jgi:hypothetical protein